MRNISKSIAIFILFTLPIFAVSAQDNPTSISYDEVVTGELSDDVYEQFYTFEGQAGDIITIRMRSTAEQGERGLDSFLYLRDDNGNELSFNDDAGGNLNSLIGPFELPYDGSYTVVATRYQQANGGSVGGYEVIVSLAETNPLTVGQSVDIDFGELSDVQFLDFTADTDAVYELSIELLQGEAGIDITARASNGDYVTGIGADPFNSFNFAVFTLNADERITMTTRSYQAYGPEGEIEFQGDVQARITLTEVNATLLSVAVNEAVAITGELDGERAVNYYLFQASSGQELAINGRTVNGGDVELFIVSPQGYSSYYGSTFYSNGDVLVPQQVLTATGDYILAVSPANLPPDAQPELFEGAINYELTLNVTSLQEVIAGEAVNGIIAYSANEYEDVYVYRGQAGEVITITLGATDENYAPGLSMELFPNDPEFDSVAPYYASFNSSFSGEPVTYTVTLPYTGDYVMRIYNTAQTPQPMDGAYSLIITSGQ